MVVLLAQLDYIEAVMSAEDENAMSASVMGRKVAG